MTPFIDIYDSFAKNATNATQYEYIFSLLITIDFL